MIARRLGLPTLVMVATWPFGPTSRGGEPPPPPADPAGVEFFEKRVRPILVERCLGCHGPEKSKGDLRLDSRAAALAGGATGPAIAPGDVESSLLIQAVRYGDLQMPPRSKLPPAEIDVLTEWVSRGAPWGVESGAPPSAGGSKGGLEGTDEFRQRAEAWCFRPIRRTAPPPIAAAPPGWPRNPIDAFLLAAMSGAGVRPVEEAGRPTLIRRLTFDLTGLPPTPDEVRAFLEDGRPDAYDRLVDRLLASPRYGEHAARRWLDLVRFAETAGHEFDYDIPHAWRYRDYVARAFNADLPYDRFVVEHLAGDLVATPRHNAADGSNESILGTGFFWLGEGVHSPLDVREEGVRRIDNQIDVLSKAFLGLTVSCARCHDHKFDPITQGDYYALAGFLRSTRHQQAFLDADDRFAGVLGELRSRKAALASLLRLAAGRLQPGTAHRAAALLRESGEAPASGRSPAPCDLSTWQSAGPAFATPGPDRFQVAEAAGGVQLVRAADGSLHSGLLSRKLQGVVRSPTFTIGARRLHVLASGSRGRINVIVDGFEKVRAPIYGGLTVVVESPGEPRWFSVDLGPWIGHRAYLEACDGASAEYTGAATRMVDGRGWIEIVAVAVDDRDAPPTSTAAPTVSIDVGVLIQELRAVDATLADRIDAALAACREAADRVPDPMLGLAALDGDAEDEFVMLRGNHRTAGKAAPRRMLLVLGGATPDPSTRGSGRLGLAHAIVEADANPLTPRVMANRLWKQHFGEGLVRSVDDFGAMGRPPSHPELLDWLADEFIRRGWSIKEMHRLIVGSAAYQMSSRPDPEADRRDPTNALLHRASVRRIEAESVRDALLAVSGRLAERPGGPGPLPFLSPFMDGRGRPAQGGPIDGDGRRSLHLQVRRNFLNPLFRAFDAPVPFSTMGRRHTSNVPSQALALLNDPLVLELCGAWADRVLAAHATDEARVEGLFRAAFSRPPTAEEASRCRAYLDDRRSGGAATPRETWSDLCHALVNVKEFIFVD